MACRSIGANVKANGSNVAKAIGDWEGDMQIFLTS